MDTDNIQYQNEGQYHRRSHLIKWCIIVGAIDVVLLLLLFLLPDCRRTKCIVAEKAFIQVVSARDGRPLGGASVKIWSTDASCDSISLTTNNEGICSFHYADSAAIVTKLLATCPGYSGALYRNLPILQVANTIFIIPLDLPSQCGTEVNNRNRSKGTHAVQDFVMGHNIAGKQFRFEYYTDAAPDTIMIYNGTSAEYSAGSAKLLWIFRGRTNTTNYTYQYSEALTLQSDNICVIVDGGTVWGYRVGCPNN